MPNIPEVVWLTIAPEVALAVGAGLVLLVDVQWKPRVTLLGWLAALGIGASLGLAVWQWMRIDRTLGDGVMSTAPFLHFGDSLVFDQAAVMARLVLGVVGLAAVVTGWEFFRQMGRRCAEALALVMLSMAGFAIMAASNHLMLMFLGLEVGSIALYILAGFARERAESEEAAIKYFLLGAVASAVFVYGVALVFAATGRLKLLDIEQHLGTTLYLRPMVLLGGIGLVVAGLAFKVSAAPFHSWAPDVYEGAPAGVVGYMATAAKIGGFAALSRILFAGFGPMSADWMPVIVGIAALSMVLGALLGIVQTDLRRILAYSGIAHAGFILTAFTADAAAAASIWFYLAVYAIQLVGAFGVVAAVSGGASARSPLSAYRGLAKTRPWLAATLTVILLGMSGMPLTSGFFAKFGVFQHAWSAGFGWLVVLGLLASVVALYFYLRIIVVMYMNEPGPEVVAEVPVLRKLALLATAAATVVLGVLPGPLLDLVANAIPL